MTPLPPYTVRESARAKHVRFTVSVDRGLEIVIPRGLDRRRLPAMVEARRAWIDRALARIEARRVHVGPPDRRPDTIELRAIAERWRVEAFPSETPLCVRADADGRLRISGRIDDPDVWRPALRRWLLRRGKATVVPWLERIAREHGFQVTRTSVRCQRTRWGSCSSSGGIHLNAQLLFLPEGLVRYVLLHELCHTRHLNHSPAFWALLRSHEPDTDRLRRDLRGAWQYVPGWLAAQAPTGGAD